ncbi:lycopene cyclase family protein [Nocardia jejuensis]|uniref:lycopene cyclase family protein n=1 Tax=Nocardia jejuensis TaxID=328049 RepID=UPI0008376BF1|nr:lycopene cyclase family protein [Nocardia jejuensis]
MSGREVGGAADVCVVGLGPTGRGLAHRAMTAGLTVVAVDPRPERLWAPTYSCWVDELPEWVPEKAIASRIERPAVWTSRELRIDRAYCVLSKRGLFESLPLDDATVVRGRARTVEPHRVELADGTEVRAAVVFDTRGQSSPGTRRSASAHGIFLDEETAAPMVTPGEGLMLDWRPENGAGPEEPPSFLYAVPLGDGTVIFEETSLGLRGGMPQHELRKRTLNRLAAHGIQLRGDEPTEAAHYPLDETPPKAGRGQVVPYGSRGGLMHPITGYCVADSLSQVDKAIDAVQRGEDPIEAVWSREARLVHWMRMRGVYGLGRLTTEQSVAMFEAFFTRPPRQQRALLSAHDDYSALSAALFMTVATTWPFNWRYDLVGWRNRNRWVGWDYGRPGTNDPLPHHEDTPAT